MRLSNMLGAAIVIFVVIAWGIVAFGHESDSPNSATFRGDEAGYSVQMYVIHSPEGKCESVILIIRDEQGQMKMRGNVPCSDFDRALGHIMKPPKKHV